MVSLIAVEKEQPETNTTQRSRYGNRYHNEVNRRNFPVRAKQNGNGQSGQEKERQVKRNREE